MSLLVQITKNSIIYFSKQILSLSNDEQIRHFIFFTFYYFYSYNYKYCTYLVSDKRSKYFMLSKYKKNHFQNFLKVLNLLKDKIYLNFKQNELNQKEIK